MIPTIHFEVQNSIDLPDIGQDFQFHCNIFDAVGIGYQCRVEWYRGESVGGSGIYKADGDNRIAEFQLVRRGESCGISVAIR
jgi:hypothetical protein